MYFCRIGDMRADRDKTQKGAAAYLHMDVGAYRRYEKGERDIPVWVVLKLADLYQTSTDYLLGRTDTPSLPRTG